MQGRKNTKNLFLGVIILFSNKLYQMCLLLLVSVFIVAACGGEEGASGGNGSDDDVVNLRVLHSFTGGQPQAPVIEPAFKSFDEDNPNIKLQIETAAGNTILEQLRTEMGVGDPPDVFTHWGMRRSENYINNNLVADLSELIASDPEMEGRYNDGAFGPVTYQGGIYALPFQGYSYYLMINKELFEQHNVTVPTTYDELREAVIQFRDAGLIPFAANNHSARYMLLTWFGQKKTVDDLIAHALAEEPFDEALLQAAEKASELARLGAFPDDYMSLATAQSLELFHAEQSPMFYQHTWTVGSIDPDEIHKYEVIPFPLGDDESVHTSLAGTGHFIYMSQAAYEDPKKREAAWELMKKIAGPEVGRQFIEEIANATALNVDYDSSKVNPILDQALKQIEDSVNVLPSYEEELFASAVEGRYWPLTDSLLLQEITPEEYVAEMNEILRAHPNVQFNE